MIIGIDPGHAGAVAVLAPDGTLEALHDTPTLTLRTSRGTRQEYDVPGLVGLLAPYAGPQTHVLRRPRSRSISVHRRWSNSSLRAAVLSATTTTT